jgi:hypothetical protein
MVPHVRDRIHFADSVCALHSSDKPHFGKLSAVPEDAITKSYGAERSGKDAVQTASGTCKEAEYP